MELILVRHAKAEERDPFRQPDDAVRRLTESGRRKMHQAALGLSRVLADVDLIVTSPYARAAETAEILAPVLTSGKPVETCKELCPGGSLSGLIGYLQKKTECQRVILVGHDTDMSEMAAQFIGADYVAGFELKKGGCCLIRFEDGLQVGGGQLIWWLTPAILRALA